jgi:hypothetical protein
MIMNNEERLQMVAGTEVSLTEAINKTLGINTKMHIEIIQRKERSYVSVESDPLPLEYFGLARFIFKEIKITDFGVFISDEDTDKNIASFTIHFEYKHQLGGSNGHEAGFLDKSMKAVLNSEYSFKEDAKILIWTIILV